MRQWIRSHLTYANVMATLAVFLVLSGGTAIALDGSNTVFSDDIVDGEVKAPDLAGNSVRTGKIQDGQVTTLDLGDNQVGSVDVLDGCLTGQDVASSSLTTDNINDSLTAADLKAFRIFDASDTGRDDPVGGGSTDATVLDNPNGFPYDVIGHCTENPAGTVLATVTLKVHGPITWAVDSTAQGGVNDNVAVPDGAERTLASLGPTTGAHWATGSYSVTGFASTGSILTMSGTVSVGTKLQSGSDCKFNATALG